MFFFFLLSDISFKLNIVKMNLKLKNLKSEYYQEAQ